MILIVIRGLTRYLKKSIQVQETFHSQKYVTNEFLYNIHQKKKMSGNQIINLTNRLS